MATAAGGSAQGRPRRRVREGAERRDERPRAEGRPLPRAWLGAGPAGSSARGRPGTGPGCGDSRREPRGNRARPAAAPAGTATHILCSKHSLLFRAHFCQDSSAACTSTFPPVLGADFQRSSHLQLSLTSVVFWGALQV